MGFDRQFDRWDVYDESFMPAGVQFEVRYKGPENKAKGEITYYIKAEKPRVFVEDTTFEGLRQKLMTALRDWYQIRWEKRLALTISLEEERYGGRGKEYNPRLMVEAYEQGLGVHDNYTYYKEAGGRILEGEYTPHGFRGDSKWVTLADTPESRALVEEITERFKQAVFQMFADLLNLDAFRNANLGALIAAGKAGFDVSALREKLEKGKV